ncbi:MAG TPA: BamA/TamA family outer membrane protein [Steroidobacteraceae bacterium]|nr:BamA/TamA family outer membrane protein [Steroidobacteraceae bacterium]
MSRSPASRTTRCAALLICALLPLSARADIEIVIPDVTEPVRNNIHAFLSLTRYAERDDVTQETISRLQRRIVSETRAALEPLGYYEPEVTYETAQVDKGWRVTIHVKPGRPVRLSEVSVAAIGPGAQERAILEVIEAQELKPGLRLNHGTYERVKGALLRAAKNDGYLDAHLTRNDLVIDRTERRATATIEMDTGKRYSYGEIKTAQDVIDDSSMRRLLRMQQGDPYTLDSLLRTQYVLDDSQYFSSVNIETGTVDRETLTVPVTVTAEPNRRHRFATSLGYGTDTEARGKFTWDNRRVNRAGHRFKMELLGSSVIKELSARYVIPVMDVALEKLEFTGKLVDEEIGDTESERAEVGAGLTQVQGRWQRVLFVRVSNETTIEPDRTRNTAHYIFPGISYSTLPSYIVGGKVRPYRLYFELRGSPTTLGSDASFLQFRFQGERIFDFAPRWHLDLRAELGTTHLESNRPTADQILDLPASQRFFAGGDRSVRGFALNELAPRDEVTGDTIGGKHMATGTIEVTRDLPRNFGIAAFYDIGNAFNDFKEPGLEYSAGLGVRYNIAVASFGLDVAQPLSESGRNPRLHLYISTQF